MAMGLGSHAVMDANCDPTGNRKETDQRGCSELDIIGLVFSAIAKQKKRLGQGTRAKNTVIYRRQLQKRKNAKNASAKMNDSILEVRLVRRRPSRRAQAR